MTEHAACLKGFAVFPAPAPLLTRARTAVRSSVQPLFEAIACHNPYPPTASTKRSTIRWSSNAVFSGVPIGTIVGLDEPRNDELLRQAHALPPQRFWTASRLG
jgi:hypothetical protein